MSSNSRVESSWDADATAAFVQPQGKGQENHTDFNSEILELLSQCQTLPASGLIISEKSLWGCWGASNGEVA